MMHQAASAMVIVSGLAFKVYAEMYNFLYVFGPFNANKELFSCRRLNARRPFCRVWNDMSKFFSCIFAFLRLFSSLFLCFFLSLCRFPSFVLPFSPLSACFFSLCIAPFPAHSCPCLYLSLASQLVQFHICRHLSCSFCACNLCCVVPFVFLGVLLKAII